MLERIYLEIGNICNLNCSFCAGTKREKRLMTCDEFRLVCERIRGYTKYIYLHVMGEPLLHPNLDELLNVASENGLAVCITTNGTLLCEKGDILIRNADKIHKISISLHAPEGNGKHDIEDYLKSVCAFAKRITPLGVYAVFRLWNMDSDEGVGKSSENAKIAELLRGEYPCEWEQKRRGYRLARNTFLEYDGVFTWPSESEASPEENGYCHGVSSQLGILADGTVVPCCLDSEGAIPLGNIFIQKMDEILHAPRLIAIKEGFKNRVAVEELCKKCTYKRRFK